ncbi:MAG TPA: hypothetical protein VGN37_04765 [Actinocatenispora sp.]
MATTPAAHGPGRRSWWRHPAAWLVAVTAVVYLNQVLFTVYVLRSHDGSAGFVARYLPGGWFALADHDPALRWLAAHLPVPTRLLAPTVLRVQAGCELPFVVSAYLTVCGWLGPALLRRAQRLVLPVSVFWTATFCLVEYLTPFAGWVAALVVPATVAVVGAYLGARVARGYPETRLLVAGALLVLLTTAGCAVADRCPRRTNAVWADYA